jgi:hypothetical protein
VGAGRAQRCGRRSDLAALGFLFHEYFRWAVSPVPKESNMRKALCCAVVLSLVPSLAMAESLVEWARQRVDQGLVKPLAAHEQNGSRFSRGRPPPRERRVRILEASFIKDRSGGKFVPFAVDVRFADSEWESDIAGCVYQGSSSIFVKVGDEYRPAAFLLGKNLDPVAGVCQAAPAES